MCPNLPRGRGYSVFVHVHPRRAAALALPLVQHCGASAVTHPHLPCATPVLCRGTRSAPVYNLVV